MNRESVGLSTPIRAREPCVRAYAQEYANAYSRTHNPAHTYTRHYLPNDYQPLILLNKRLDLSGIALAKNLITFLCKYDIRKTNLSNTSIL